MGVWFPHWDGLASMAISKNVVLSGFRKNSLYSQTVNTEQVHAIRFEGITFCTTIKYGSVKLLLKQRHSMYDDYFHHVILISLVQSQ